LNLIYSLDSLGRASINWGPEILKVNPRLISELTLGDLAALPPRLRLLDTVWLSKSQHIPAAMLFEILPAQSGVP
jgi:hypothetical protein